MYVGVWGLYRLYKCYILLLFLMTQDCQLEDLQVRGLGC